MKGRINITSFAFAKGMSRNLDLSNGVYVFDC